MKLKGQNIKKIKPDKKKKMQETLNRMEETRKEDDKFLRNVIKNKLTWAKNLKIKTLEEIKTISQSLKNRQIILNQLNTIIPAFEELLELPKKIENNDNN